MIQNLLSHPCLFVSQVNKSTLPFIIKDYPFIGLSKNAPCLFIRPSCFNVFELNLLQLNECKTDPHFLQISQNFTSDCLLISVFFPHSSCFEQKIVLIIKWSSICSFIVTCPNIRQVRVSTYTFRFTPWISIVHRLCGVILKLKLSGEYLQDLQRHVHNSFFH